ncbi:DUF6221 family protein [Streptomyces xanthophaeus]|uniref:DUF6221 family protein n=1 Tax=Streptomyces xanthophaeus TaxID=67385 RepID=UPI00398FAC10
MVTAAGNGPLTGHGRLLARKTRRFPFRDRPACCAARPARVLREVEAKRRVLARHVLSPAAGDPERPWENRDDCQYDGETWPCDDLLDLASPYADHADYPRHP